MSQLTEFVCEHPTLGIYPIAMPCDGGDIRGKFVNCAGCEYRDSGDPAKCARKQAGRDALTEAVRQWNAAVASGKKVWFCLGAVERRIKGY